jgi:hypothetical protein
MSFLSILKSIGHAAQTVVADVAPFAPVIGAIPTVGPVFQTVFEAIVAVEQLIGSPGAGAAKKAVVTQIVNANHPNVDAANLSASIDNVVQALNLLEQAGVKI